MKEQAQVINQTIAELATMPYLHEMSQHEIELVKYVYTFLCNYLLVKVPYHA